jgi:MFS family permease
LDETGEHGGSQRNLWLGGLGRLVLADGISVSGDWLLFTASSIVVFERTGSTAAVSLLWALVAIPTVILGPFAGAMADRHDRRIIMVVADLASAAVLAVCIPVVAGGYTIAAVYASVLSVNVLAAFHRPASEALLPMLAPDESLGRANSALRMATRVAMIGGPAVASALSVRGGLTLVLVVDAATFVASAGVIAAIAGRHVANAATDHAGSAFRAALDGLRYARANRRVRAVVLSVGATMLVAPLVNATTVALVSNALHEPESRYGILLAAEGGGALALALALILAGPRLPLLPMGAVALLVIGTSTIGLGLSQNLATALVANTVMGMAVVAMQVAFVSYLQRVTADEFRGRVMSLISTVSSVGALLGLSAAGPLVYAAGVRGAFVVAGAAVCLSTLPVLLLVLRPVPAPAPSATPGTA